MLNLVVHKVAVGFKWAMLLHHQVDQFASGVDVSQTFHLHLIGIMQFMYTLSSLHHCGL